jgi:tetratricopeptide (TPR) repeat protein
MFRTIGPTDSGAGVESPKLTTGKNKSKNRKEALGLRIKELRIALGLQQKDLTAGEFSQAYISLVEAGRLLPSARALELIAARLQVTPTDLLVGKPKDPPIINNTTSDPVVPILEAEEEKPDSSSASVNVRDWELLAVEISLLLRENPEVARNLLIRKTKVRQLRPAQLKQYYYLLGQCSYLMGNLFSAQADFMRSLDLAVRSTDMVTEAHNYNQLGLIQYTEGKLSQALAYHQRAMDLFDQISLTTKINTSGNLPIDPSFDLELSYNLANDLFGLGDHKQAFVYYKRVKLLIESLWQPKQLLAQKLWDLSQRYSQAGDSQHTRFFASRALQVYSELDAEHIQARVEARYGFLLSVQGEAHLQQALLHGKELLDPLTAAEAAINLSALHPESVTGSINTNTNATTEEQRYAEEGLFYAEQSGHKLYIGQALARLAEIYFNRNEFETALGYFERALNLLEQVNTGQVLGKVYTGYARTLAKLQRADEAVQAFEQAWQYQQHSHFKA